MTQNNIDVAAAAAAGFPTMEQDAAIALRGGQSRRSLILHVLCKKREDEDLFTLKACRLSEPLTAEQRTQQAATRLIMHLFLNSKSKVAEAWVDGNSQNWTYKHEWAIVRLAASTPFVADRVMSVLSNETFDLNDYREDMEFAFTLRPNAPMEQWLDDQPMREYSSDSDDCIEDETEEEHKQQVADHNDDDDDEDTSNSDADAYMTPQKPIKRARE